MPGFSHFPNDDRTEHAAAPGRFQHHRRLTELSQRLELDDTHVDTIVAELAAALSAADGDRNHDAD
ncbi:MAG: hypothetical protein LC646_03750 [Xanthomonadaceae bacterium]|nr:hypothetical protein [Xanthomonadaceae bacterium]